jgi:large subunit ribosomal protein L14
MVQSQSMIKCADNTGAKILMVIGVRVGSSTKTASIGDIVSCSVKKAQAGGSVKTHEIVHAVMVRTRKEVRRPDGSYIRFDDNACVIIDIKSKDPKGTAVFGPVGRELRERGFMKVISLAPEVL